jgi:membrane carboxypeptidase/penicillin-binding protein PbpC
LYSVEEITERSPNGNQIPVDLALSLAHDNPPQVLQPQIAYLMQNILSDDVARTATINGARSSFPPNSQISGASLGLPNQNYIAAKTGTNNTVGGNPSRIWTVGFSNNYAVGVWVGTLNQGTAMNGDVSGLAGAAPAWNSIMRAARNNRNPGQFDRPSNIVQNNVCFLTGTIAGDDCQTRVTELFVSSLPPQPATSGFATTVSIDSWTGLRANEWCPENIVTQTVSNINDEWVVSWLRNTPQGRNILTTLGLPQDLTAAPYVSSCTCSPTTGLSGPRPSSRFSIARSRLPMFSGIP